MLRIIAGKYRSRILKQPSKTITRPTIDRAREAIFSSIQFNIENKKVLDLFSGSGAFCLEALSRGAKFAVCVDKNAEAIKIIKENQNSLKEPNLKIFNIDALNFLNNNVEVFDYIYLDPPFVEKKLLVECLNKIIDKKCIDKSGTMIIETDWKDFNYSYCGFEITKSKKYGKIYFYYISNIDDMD
ncbi:16S rRNA (guanine(966)-N(2))-methyltransferase RsmD [Metamycoplasma hominis]|uniref:16S rRNA (guanine(966)-N(2))-methyltransferase RsmD n=1 Tax=Metamycoplasma hominis TaxID=2098 RepID=UPI0005CDC6FF|nr:16S rRNA (guanine(966)-N(2))-methyltransferase RsmD [Metamycoplasma hominis]OKL23138.1 16S rRNA (guanine(966)-N(2))-methyltransferase RsmD [Metamycoplasma hominis]RCI99989.1 16S rRNA (guanine(966)-N(2))-methyltransferase RsmD [Metamycoplasma hominis]RCJ01268.1 16S rRNA (guanine(966)-N(2))-methyltransferase RsmD [Metamycoplasma hominis]